MSNEPTDHIRISCDLQSVAVTFGSEEDAAHPVRISRPFAGIFLVEGTGLDRGMSERMWMARA